jgi:hypothetical protein
MTECLDIVSCLIALQGIYEMVKVYAHSVLSSSLFDPVKIFWHHACVEN